MFMVKDISKDVSEKNEFREDSSEKKEEVKKNEVKDGATVIKENSIEDKHDDVVQMAQSADYKNTNSEMVKNKDNYAGFWVRYAAGAIDGFIVMMITMPVLFIVGILFAVLESFLEGVIVKAVLDGVTVLIALGVGLVYYIMMTNKYQATLGKMAVGAKVESENNKKLELKSLAIREIIKLAVSSFLPLIHVIIAFTGKKQGLHDFAAKSVVVYTNSVERARGWVVGIVLGLQAIMVIFGIVLFLLIGVAVFSALENSDFSSDGASIESFFENLESVPDKF